MSKKYEYPKVLYAAKADFIDPIECDSTVGYKIASTEYFSAYVDLSDCNRKISWAFEPEPEAIEKIDKAITLLCDFRKELVKAIPKWNKLVKEAEAFDAANKDKK